MFFFINLLFIIFIHFIIKIIFFSKIPNFRQITFIYFICYIFLILSYSFNILNIDKNPENLIYLAMNLLIFLSYILTIGLKKINSPTFYILEFFKIKNITKEFEIIKYLENKRIFDERFDELISERMIELKNNEIKLTKQGRFFALFMRILSKFFGVKSSG
tara:strand:+ start:117 stop:599 length:483 start_codon:yes stop_codon:yes gene_type:complete